MKYRWVNFVVLVVLATSAHAQIARTATFENFTVGQTFKPSFTDPISEITFSNATSSVEGFAIASGLSQFAGTHYLNSASDTGWTYQFGFTGNIPVSADQVSLEISDGGSSNTAGVTLEGFDANNALVAQQSGSSNEPDPFTLQITSSQYDITSFKVIAAGIFTGYDNIGYTILPEPASISFLLLSSIIPSQICRAKGSAQ
jgi:hypothetical protein